MFFDNKTDLPEVLSRFFSLFPSNEKNVLFSSVFHFWIQSLRFFVVAKTELQEEHRETILPVLLACLYLEPGKAKTKISFLFFLFVFGNIIRFCFTTTCNISLLIISFTHFFCFFAKKNRIARGTPRDRNTGASGLLSCSAGECRHHRFLSPSDPPCLVSPGTNGGGVSGGGACVARGCHDPEVGIQHGRILYLNMLTSPYFVWR